MGFRPFITTDSLKTGEVRLIRVYAGGGEYLGPPLPLGGEGLNFDERENMPRVLVHENEPWVLHSGTVWRLQNHTGGRTGTWINEYRFQEFTGTNAQKSNNAGFHKVIISGIPHFLSAYPTSTTPNWRGVKYNTITRQWTESAALNRTNACSLSTHVVAEVWKNRLYWGFSQTTNAPVFTYYNPIDNSLNAITTSSSVDTDCSDTCIYKGRMVYAGRVTGSNTTLSVVEIQDTANASRLTLSSAGNGTNQGGAKPCVFIYGDYLYVFFGTSSGVRIFQVLVDGLGVWSYTDITTTTAPERFSVVSQTPDFRLRTLLDVHDTSSPPDIYVLINSQVTGTFTDPMDIWKWNGPNVRMTKISSCGYLDSWALPDKNGAGHRSFIPGMANIEVVGIDDTGSQGDLRISYRIIESYQYPSGTPCNVSFLVNINSQETLDTNAVLRPGTSSPDGNVSSNIISGLTTGSGLLRTVSWRAGLQGAIPSGWQRVAGVVEII